MENMKISRRDPGVYRRLAEQILLSSRVDIGCYRMSWGIAIWLGKALGLPALANPKEKKARPGVAQAGPADRVALRR